jgi:uncharacterized protein (DUF362 family)
MEVNMTDSSYSPSWADDFTDPSGRRRKPVVSIVKIKKPCFCMNYRKRIFRAVKSAIRLLGGFRKIMPDGPGSIMLKPNLVGDASPPVTTNMDVVRALAVIMKKAGNSVMIGEGSAMAAGYNNDPPCYTKDPGILENFQQDVFNRLGYTEMADSISVPLVNLHIGPMVEVNLPDGKVDNKITLHRGLTQIDLLCSVPVMKTHNRAHVTLGMKNLIGLYPGTVYGNLRAEVHDAALAKGSDAISYEIVDMVRANPKFGLTVIDCSTAMEGNGPSGGSPRKMDLIIAGTNPLATDVVAASVMGFDPKEIQQLYLAHSLGMGPIKLSDIEVRGARVRNVKQDFEKPVLQPWTEGEIGECSADDIGFKKAHPSSRIGY